MAAASLAEGSKSPGPDDDETSPAPDNALFSPTKKAPTVDPYRPDSDLGPLSERFDPEHCHLATDAEVAALNSRVLVLDEEKQQEFVMFCGAAEFYVMGHLRDRVHSFENGDDIPSAQTNPYVSMSFPLGKDAYTPDVSVARPGGRIFDALLGDVPMNLPLLLQFVLEHGDCQEKRDGSVVSRNGTQRRRLMLGTCGLAYSEESLNGKKKPVDTYGLGVFDKIDDQEKKDAIVGTIAGVLDAMQDSHDQVRVQKLGKPRPCNDPWREDKFAAKFRNAIGAERSRFEDLTIQVKCISQHERTIAHKDNRNCTKLGYTDTCAFCIVLKDANGDLWSIKFVANSRAAAGTWQDDVFELEPILTRIHSQIQLVDQFYQNLAHTQSEKGGHSYHGGLTARTHRNLVLDDSCPWKEENIGNDGEFAYFARRMLVPALFVRDFHLSSACTVGFHMQRRLKDERKTIELLTMAAYMGGWSRFYYLCTEKFEDIVQSKERPSKVYYDLAQKRFGKAFGDNTPGRVTRISPSNIDYPKVYLDEDGNVTKKMDDVIDGVLGVLKWIDETVGTDDFNHANIQETIKACCADVRGS